MARFAPLTYCHVSSDNQPIRKRHASAFPRRAYESSVTWIARPQPRLWNESSSPHQILHLHGMTKQPMKSGNKKLPRAKFCILSRQTPFASQRIYPLTLLETLPALAASLDPVFLSAHDFFLQYSVFCSFFVFVFVFRFGKKRNDDDDDAMMIRSPSLGDGEAQIGCSRSKIGYGPGSVHWRMVGLSFFFSHLVRDHEGQTECVGFRLRTRECTGSKWRTV